MLTKCSEPSLGVVDGERTRLYTYLYSIILHLQLWERMKFEISTRLKERQFSEDISLIVETCCGDIRVSRKIKGVILQNNPQTLWSIVSIALPEKIGMPTVWNREND